MASVAVEAFLLLGAAILAGFLGHAIFRRHRVSDILVLLLVGFTLGPMFGILDPAWLKPAMPVLAPLGLVIILFEGGLGLRWEELRKHGAGALAFSLVSWLATVAALYVPLHYALGLAPHLALMFAVAVGATGIVAVVPLLAQLRAPPKARVWLTVETGVGDLLSAVAVVALATYHLQGGTPLAFGTTLAARIVLGAAVGFLGGLAFARVLHHLRERAHAYPVTLGGLLVAYAATETIGGSGYLSALVFGLVVGNANELMRAARVPALASLTDASRQHQGEIIFLLRSVYFVYLGLSVGRELLTWASLFAALLLTATLLVARVATVGATYRGDARTGLLLAGMMPRAMAAAVLASIPWAMGVPGSGSFLALALLVVVGSDVMTTLGVYAYERSRPHPSGDAASAATTS